MNENQSKSMRSFCPHSCCCCFCCPHLNLMKIGKIYFGNFRCLLPTVKYVNFNYAKRHSDRPRLSYSAPRNTLGRRQLKRQMEKANPEPKPRPEASKWNLLRQFDRSTNVSILCKIKIRICIDYSSDNG